jgi:hypothetical protein
MSLTLLLSESYCEGMCAPYLVNWRLSIQQSRSGRVSEGEITRAPAGNYVCRCSQQFAICRPRYDSSQNEHMNWNAQV